MERVRERAGRQALHTDVRGVATLRRQRLRACIPFQSGECPAHEVGPRSVDREHHWGDGEHGVHADESLGMLVSELRREERAQVAAVCREAFVAKTVDHEAHPQVGRLPEVEVWRRRVREREPRERRDHDVERVRGVASVRAGIGEWPDERAVVVERPRPPVREHDRQRVGPGAAHVHEVHGGAIDVGTEVGQVVEALLLGPPVVTIAPTVDEPLEELLRDTVRPVARADRRNRAVPVQPLAEIIEYGVGNVDRVRLQLDHRSHSEGIVVARPRHDFPGRGSRRAPRRRSRARPGSRGCARRPSASAAPGVRVCR